MATFFSPIIEQAIELAAQWHNDVYRKGRWRDPAFDVPEGEVLRVPAIAHVTAVAMGVQRAGWEDAAVAAAFLHDVLEDANRYGAAFKYEEMERLVGSDVAALVLVVTEHKYHLDGALRSWRERKEDYVAQLRDGPPQAVAISLSDKLHNLWSINESLSRGIDVFAHAEHRRALTAGPEAQLWFHHAVLEASRGHFDPRLEPMRARVLEEIARFVRLAGLD